MAFSWGKTARILILGFTLVQFFVGTYGIYSQKKLRGFHFFKDSPTQSVVQLIWRVLTIHSKLGKGDTTREFFRSLLQTI